MDLKFKVLLVKTCDAVSEFELVPIVAVVLLMTDAVGRGSSPTGTGGGRGRGYSPSTNLRHRAAVGDGGGRGCVHGRDRVRAAPRAASRPMEEGYWSAGNPPPDTTLWPEYKRLADRIKNDTKFSAFNGAPSPNSIVNGKIIAIMGKMGTLIHKNKFKMNLEYSSFMPFL
jgi:hypothetical protein